MTSPRFTKDRPPHSTPGASRVAPSSLKIIVHRDDLPEDFTPTSVAIDTETMGLRLGRDRLCLVQLCDGSSTCHLVHIQKTPAQAPNLVRLLQNNQVEKIFHYGRFDIAALYHAFGVLCQGPIYCTKIASKLARTYTDFHGLRTLVRELLKEDISKAEQSSDWGKGALTEAQERYAATDVLYLHRLKAVLTPMIEREGRHHLLAMACAALAGVALMDVQGFPCEALFSH